MASGEGSHVYSLILHGSSQPRRTCVGMHFAEQALFISIATMLWAFDIQPPLNEQGDVVMPSKDELVDSGLVV